MSDRRFRAESRLVYSQALAALVRYARGSTGTFFYGPVDLPRLESEGLLVSGPGADGAADLLAGIPGLAEVQA